MLKAKKIKLNQQQNVWKRKTCFTITTIRLKKKKKINKNKPESENFSL